MTDCKLSQPFISETCFDIPSTSSQAFLIKSLKLSNEFKSNKNEIINEILIENDQNKSSDLLQKNVCLNTKIAPMNNPTKPKNFSFIFWKNKYKKSKFIENTLIDYNNNVLAPIKLKQNNLNENSFTFYKEFWNNNSNNNFYKKRNVNFCSGYANVRYLILIITILCMTAIKSNEISFNLTVICMTSNSTSDPISMTPKEISAVFAGGGIGAIAMVLPIVYVLHYLGSRLVFTGLLILSSFGTLILPTLARYSPIYMVSARIAQGLALSAVLPLMGCISAQWAPNTEITKFMTLLTSSNQLAQIITMPLSAKLCVTTGWSSVYYIYGAITAIFAILFCLIFRSTPRKHPCITQKEIQYITNGSLFIF